MSLTCFRVNPHSFMGSLKDCITKSRKPKLYMVTLSPNNQRTGFSGLAVPKVKMIAMLEPFTRQHPTHFKPASPIDTWQLVSKSRHN